MRSTELRLGNLVWRVHAPYGTEHSRWTEVVDRLETLRDMLTLPSSYAEAIDISSDWLVKFGFEVEDTSSFSLGYEMPFKVYRKGQLTYNSLQATWWYHGVLEKQPKYIHELQNLYFALTGEELSIGTINK
jgi:hypothetical protein